MSALDSLATRLAPVAPTLLRVVVGLVFFMHGYQKVFVNGFEATGDGFSAMGIPLPYAMGVFVPLLELVGGLMLIAGLLTRVLGVMFAVVSLVAAVTAHGDGGFYAQDGGWEYLLVLGVASLALVVSGAGAFALDGLFRRVAGSAASYTTAPAPWTGRTPTARAMARRHPVAR
jgi:putative oxidoreductase